MMRHGWVTLGLLVGVALGLRIAPEAGSAQTAPADAGPVRCADALPDAGGPLSLEFELVHKPELGVCVRAVNLWSGNASVGERCYSDAEVHRAANAAGWTPSGPTPSPQARPAGGGL